MTGPIRVQTLDFDPTDAGFTILPNYTARFWFPLLKSPTAVGLYLILLVHADQDGYAWPSVSTLADSLSVDRRSITGRTQLRDGRTHRYFGAIDQLEKHGLLRTERVEPDEGNPFWRFYVRRRPPILTPAQAAELPDRLQNAHDRWLDKWIKGGGEHHSKGWCTPLPGVVSTTRTRSIEQDPENKIGEVGTENAADHQPDSPPWGVLQAWPEVATLLSRVGRPNTSTALLRALQSLRPVSLADGVLTLRGPRRSAQIATDNDVGNNPRIATAFAGIADVNRLEILGPTDD